MFEVILDNVSCSQYGLIVANKPTIPTVKEKINVIEIQGRSSNLTEKEGYENKVININFGVIDRENLAARTRIFIPYLINAKILKFNDDLEVFYKIKNVKIGDVERQLNSIGRFTVTFVVEPFSYLESELIVIEKSTVIYNQGTHESVPYLKIYGEGDVTINVNNKTIYLKEIQEYVEIDSDLMQCRKDTQNTNKKMIGDFPILNKGENTINFTNATKIEINPRWRYL